MALSKNQLDKVGDRLRRPEAPRDADLAIYDEYRDSHYGPLAEVATQVEEITGIEPSSRLKHLESVIEKLRRQPGRLSRIADIAGCRIRVASLLEQQAALDQIQAAFPGARVRDYRTASQFGYRAVHVITTLEDGKSVEIQVRTMPQNMWANLSESVARGFDIRLKYGGGPESILVALGELSEHAAELDDLILQARESRLSAERDADGLDRLVAASFESFHRESVTLLVGAHHDSLPD
ncbi:MAG: hypothetical protein WD557_17370 [Dehalococcoidia bacterium]